MLFFGWFLFWRVSEVFGLVFIFGVFVWFLGWFLLCSVFIAHSNIYSMTEMDHQMIITGKKFSSFLNKQLFKWKE